MKIAREIRVLKLATITVALTLAMSALGLTSARAQASHRDVRTDKQVYVAGADAGVAFEGTLLACANSDVTLGLYRRGPASQDNSMLGEPRPVTVKVGPDGRIRGSILLDPARLIPATVWGAVSGACLEKPYFTDVTIHVAILDAKNNPNGSGTIFIPAWVLSDSVNIGEGRTLAESVGAITVLADGVVCVKASLVSGSVLDAEGNARVRVGDRSQPSQCVRAGAALTFARGDGELLVESRTLIPGVTQPLANLARRAPGTGSQPGAVPTEGSAVPAAVQTVRERKTLAPWRLAALAGGVAGAVGATWLLARRR